MPVLIIDNGPTAWQWVTQFWIPIAGIVAVVLVAIFTGRLTSQLARREREDRREESKQFERERRAAFQEATERYMATRDGWGSDAVLAAAGVDIGTAGTKCGQEAQAIVPWLERAVLDLRSMEVANAPGSAPKIEAFEQSIRDRIGQWVETGVFDSAPLSDD